MTADEQPVLALVRGDHELHEGKLSRVLQQEIRPAHPDEVRGILGVEVGFVGPVGVPQRVRVIADECLAPTGPGGERPYVVGGNKAHVHLRGVKLGRDLSPAYADLREARSGDQCPFCGGKLGVEQVLEVGNIFKLGLKYSVPMKANVLDESGKERPVVMGSYGIGPARIAAGAVEQCHDERGIIWPKAIAPFDVYLVQVQSQDDLQTEVAASLHDALELGGLECLWDNRQERAGVKFADADLIGCPVRVTVGKRVSEGLVEVQPRAGGARQEVSVSDVPEVVKGLLA